MSTPPRGPAETAERRALIDELQFLGQMSSTETALFHHLAAAKVGLGVTDSKTISTLAQEGPMTAGQLARRLSLTTGAVTSVIDRLSEAGFVTRVADPADRRRVIVEVVARKLATMERIYASIGESFERFLARYSDDELRFLVDHLRATLELTRDEIKKLG